MSPFKLLYGYKPQISFNWNRPIGPITARKYLNYKKAQIFTKRMHGAWETAKAIIKRAQEKKKSNIN